MIRGNNEKFLRLSIIYKELKLRDASKTRIEGQLCSHGTKKCAFYILREPI